MAILFFIKKIFVVFVMVPVLCCSIYILYIMYMYNTFCTLYVQYMGASIKKSDVCAIRASGLIPVIPLTVINKDTHLPMCIEEQAINY